MSIVLDYKHIAIYLGRSLILELLISSRFIFLSKNVFFIKRYNSIFSEVFFKNTAKIQDCRQFVLAIGEHILPYSSLDASKNVRDK